MFTTPRPRRASSSGMAALGATGRWMSTDLSILAMEAATMKKMSSWKTQSIIGVMSISQTGSSGLRSFMAGGSGGRRRGGDQRGWPGMG